MIFVDLLKKLEPTIEKDFDKIIQTALNNQQHHGDMLLWVANGFYDEDVLNFRHPEEGKTYNPHVIGDGEIGHSENTHYRFIDQYRRAYLKNSFDDYIKELEYPNGVYSKEHSKKVDELTNFEETTINLEMLVYLKFWESDSIIKKLYELVKIVHSEPYDWYFRVAISDRDTSATGTRQNVIRKEIRDRLQSFGEVYKAMKTAYKTQIRNAIAHSTFAFQGRYIQLHNYVAKDIANQLKSLSFNDWIEMFHLTVILHNCYIRSLNQVKNHYAELAKKSGNECEILIIERGGKKYTKILEFRPEFGDWHYKI